LKVSAVRPEGFQADENKVLLNVTLVNRAFEVLDGDLLMTRANTPELVGLTCLVQRPRPQLLLSDKTLRLRVGDQDDRRYIFLATQMPYLRRQIEIDATGSSGSMKNIGQKAIRSLRILRPPRGEQRIIADTLTAHGRRLEAEI